MHDCEMRDSTSAGLNARPLWPMMLFCLFLDLHALRRLWKSDSEQPLRIFAFRRFGLGTACTNGKERPTEELRDGDLFLFQFYLMRMKTKFHVIRPNVILNSFIASFVSFPSVHMDKNQGVHSLSSSS